MVKWITPEECKKDIICKKALVYAKMTRYILKNPEFANYQLEINRLLENLIKEAMRLFVKWIDVIIDPVFTVVHFKDIYGRKIHIRYNHSGYVEIHYEQ